MSGQAKNSKGGLTFCLLALPRGSPSEASPVLIQVKEPDEPFGPTLQFDHLCPRLHYTHASFNCKRDWSTFSSHTMHMSTGVQKPYGQVKPLIHRKRLAGTEHKFAAGPLERVVKELIHQA